MFTPNDLTNNIIYHSLIVGGQLFKKMNFNFRYFFNISKIH